MLISGVNDNGKKKMIIFLDRKLVFTYFVETLLGCCFHTYNDLFLMFTIAGGVVVTGDN